MKYFIPILSLLLFISISNAASAEAGVPTALSPSGTISTNQPTFTWTAVPGTKVYLVYAVDAAGELPVWRAVGANQAGCASGTGSCSYTHPSAIFVEGTGAFWNVTIFDRGFGPESNTLEFTVDTGETTPATQAPTALSPSGTIDTDQPTFTWTAVPDTTYYALYARDAEGVLQIWNIVGADTAGCASGTGNCSYTHSPAIFAEGSGGHWLVLTADDEYGPDSNILEFTVDTSNANPPVSGIPKQLTPDGTINTNTPTFTWEPVPGFTSYAIYAVDSSNEVKVNNIVGCTTNTCSYTKSNSVFADGPATWEIRTEADDGTNGIWSDILNFTVDTESSCDLSKDSDNDRLPDCYETNTGVFLSNLDTGTDPNKADTDGDAINDGDEVLGTQAGLDLPGMGVSPVHKDLLVEYDWFEDEFPCNSGEPHTHRPTEAIVNLVSAGFASAPADLINNPDGQPGVNVIHDYGQGGLFTGGNFIDDSDGIIDGIPDQNSQQDGIYFENIKNQNFDANRRGYFYRVLLAHAFGEFSNTVSGTSELPGDDTIVATRCGEENFHPGATTELVIANTIMHELGHNLGLRHGGGQFLNSGPDMNYKPNYNSVMNYRFQFPGIDSDSSCDSQPDGIIGFSNGTRLSLDESNLDETLGVCGNIPIDFSGDGFFDVGILAEINIIESFAQKDDFIEYTGQGDNETHTLLDNNDWEDLDFYAKIEHSNDGAQSGATWMRCQGGVE